MLRQIDRRRQQSRRRKKNQNKGRVTGSDRKRKLLAQNFQKVGILFLQKNPPASQRGATSVQTPLTLDGLELP